MASLKPLVIEPEEPKALEVRIWDRTLLFYEPSVPAMLDLSETDINDPQAAGAAIRTFLDESLDGDDREWFEAHMRDKVERITPGMLSQIIEGVIGAFMPERPTTPPSASRRSRATSGRGSTGPALSTA